jgi:hypothetical protein
MHDRNQPAPLQQMPICVIDLSLNGLAVAGDHSTLCSKTSQDFAMTKNIPGARTNPEGIPQEGHGGSNVRGTQHQ